MSTGQPRIELVFPLVSRVSRPCSAGRRVCVDSAVGGACPAPGHIHADFRMSLVGPSGLLTPPCLLPAVASVGLLEFNHPLTGSRLLPRKSFLSSQPSSKNFSVKIRPRPTSPQTQTESHRPPLHFRAQEARPQPLLIPTLVTLPEPGQPLIPLPPALRAL